MATVQELWKSFVDDSGWPQTAPPPRRQVEVWLQDPSLEIRGLLFHFLVEGKDRYKVEPPFTEKDLFPFVARYFEDCLSLRDGSIEESKWVLSGFDLSHGIASWALRYWQQQGRANEDCPELNSWLRTLLLTFPQHQSLLAVAISDHFFLTNKWIRKQFASWSRDPQLAALFPELSEKSN